MNYSHSNSNNYSIWDIKPVSFTFNSTFYVKSGITGNDLASFLKQKSAGNLILEKWLIIQSFPSVTRTYVGIVNENSFFKEVVFNVPANYLIQALTFLKKGSFFYYEQLIDVSAIDHYKEEIRFEVIYQLLSITYTKRIILAVSLSESAGVNSATAIYASAGWYERETWDRFGVFFYNHPDLRRMLTDYGFKGHPLRKDFPVTGFVEVRYNTNIKSIAYEKVSLAQAFREIKASF